MYTTKNQRYLGRLLKYSLLAFGAAAIIGCGGDGNSTSIAAQSATYNQAQILPLLRDFTSAVPGKAERGNRVATVYATFHATVNPVLLQDLNFQLSGSQSDLFRIDEEGYIVATSPLPANSSYDLKLTITSDTVTIGVSEIKILCGSQMITKSGRCHTCKPKCKPKPKCNPKPKCKPKPKCNKPKEPEKIIIHAPQVNNKVHIPEGKNFVMEYAYTDGDGHFSIDPTSTDHAFFFMENNHTLKTIVPFDYENPQDQGGDNTYTVGITDGQYYQQELTIVVDNIADTPPIIEDMLPATIGDDTPLGTIVGDINITEHGEFGIDFITIDSTDFIVEYDFGTDPNRAHVVVNRPLDANARADYSLTLTAYNESGFYHAQALIHIDDISTEAPIMKPLLASVDENSVSGTLVGSIDFESYGDSDINPGSIVLYEEDGTTLHSGPFTAQYNATTKQVDIKVKAGYDPNKLDYEKIKQYSLKVEAANTAGSTKCCVFIRINDVDEDAPIFISDEPVTKIMQENLTHVGNFKAIDATLPIHFAITGGDDREKFTVTQIDNNSFSLNFDTNAFDSGAPDFEQPASDDGDNEYIVQVTGTDSTAQAYHKTIEYRVNIENVVEDTPRIINQSAIGVDPFSTPIATINLSNAPLDGPVTYAIESVTDSHGNNVTSLFVLRNGNSNLIERAGLLTNGETYTINVSATTGGPRIGYGTITVTIAN